MSIRAKLEAAITPITKTITYRGETYTLVGTPDGAIYADTFLLSEAELRNRVCMWRQFAGEDFPESVAPEVMAIARTLCHEDDPSARYQEHEIAQLVRKDGPLFLELTKAAFEVLGFDDRTDSSEVVLQAALGNSSSETRED